MDETNKQAIFAALVISLLVTGVALYFYFSNPKNKPVRQTNTIVEKSSSDTIKSKKETEEENNAEEEEEEETDDTAPEKSKEENSWMNYNSFQGISFGYPRESLGTDCAGEKNTAVPVKILEDKENGYVYLTTGCSDTLETLRKKTAKASSVKNNYKQEKAADVWSIAISTVKNDSELNAFIDKHYGTGGCEVGKMELLEGRNGIYKVTIRGKDWINPGDRITTSQTCKVDYAYKILYAPKKSKALSIILGQGCTFLPIGGEDCYETENKIIDSIKFD
jgi:hypothetical protein